MHNYGNFVRLLMLNSSKNTTTKKQDLKIKYEISNKEVLSLIDYTKSKLEDIGLELVGIEKNEVVDPLTSEKYAIRRSESISGNIDVDKKISVIYVLILLDDGSIDLTKLVQHCKKIVLFKDDDIENYLRYLKKDNFINFVKVNEEFNVVLGYRYFIEYGDLNILDMLVN